MTFMPPARLALFTAFVLALAACCSEDSNGNCSDGCLHDSEQQPCTNGSPPISGTLRISYSSPSGWDSVVVEIHHSSVIEGSAPYEVFRPKSGTEITEYVLDGDWSGSATYWRGGIQRVRVGGDDISYGKSYGCTCYTYTTGSAHLDLAW